ncbi:cytosine-specific methyltransferase [Acetobacter sp. CAG:977]|nr:cytosine-specific methyltransferase [Acetobacter sp. CAG:977]
MSNNSTLNNAKNSPDTDEWYTTYESIVEELNHYEAQFYNKIVLCNCDDPFNSNFTYYFLQNFNRLHLKKLICTSYSKSKIKMVQGNTKISMSSQKDKKTTPESYILMVSEVPGNPGDIVSDMDIAQILKKKGVVKRLKGEGDFRSKTCVKYLKQCDICCTNPPFSLFSNLFSLLIKYNKKFLLIGNQNALTYKEIFPYIKKDKAWIGYRFGHMAFRVPQDSKPRKTRFWIDHTGQKWRSIGNAMWLTNLDIPKRHKFLELTQHYSPSKYPKYDNFDAINVNRVKDIPIDYNGIMGVPITFLKYYNCKQFEIIGEANHGSDNEFDLFKPLLSGKALFKRILIKRKLDENGESYEI